MEKGIKRRHIKEHNHQTDEMIFKQYPEQRCLTEKERETAETMLNMGVKVKLLQDYFQKSGKIVFFWVQIYKSNLFYCFTSSSLSAYACYDYVCEYFKYDWFQIIHYTKYLHENFTFVYICIKMNLV